MIKNLKKPFLLFLALFISFAISFPEQTTYAESSISVTKAGITNEKSTSKSEKPQTFKLKQYTLTYKDQKWKLTGTPTKQERDKKVFYLEVWEDAFYGKTEYKITVPKKGKVSFSFSTPTNYGRVQVALLNSKRQYQETIEYMVKEVEKFLHASEYVETHNPKIIETAKTITKGKATDEEKSKAIFEWVAKNIAYDTKAYNAGDIKLYSSTETLKSRKAMCNGYSHLVAALHRVVGIKASVVVSEEHAWNEVYIKNKTYLVDATWGAGWVDGDLFTPSFQPEYYSETLWDTEVHKKTGILDL